MNSTGTYATRTEGLGAVCHQIHAEVPWLSPAEFLERSREERWTIVDVRTAPERAVSIIPGAVSKEEFEARLDEHAKSKVLVYCTAGCRSGAYAEALRQRGVNAFNLRGGVLAWALNGGSFATFDGKSTRQVHVHGERWDVLPPGYEAVK
ncbi:MAG: rhodanese-like domain-containing protein [Anaerolineae bacterium]|jgi:sodium/bile acid cotransporter 7